MSYEESIIFCQDHGQRPGTLVCTHIYTQQGRGFYMGEAEAGDPCPNAWCAECEALFQKEEEWSDRALAIADFSLVCDRCYATVKARNQVTSLH